MKATLHEKKLILFGPERFTNGKAVLEFRSVFTASVENNYLNIIIDLSQTQYIDSSGLGELVASYTTLTRRGGSVALNRLAPKARDFLQMAKLLNILQVFDVDYSSSRTVEIKGDTLDQLQQLQG